MSSTRLEAANNLLESIFPRFDPTGLDQQGSVINAAAGAYSGIPASNYFASGLAIAGNAQFNITGNTQFNLLGAVGSFLEAQQVALNAEVTSLRRDISSLRADLIGLTEEIQRIQETHIFVIPLATLAPQPYRMLHQIPVTIKEDGDEFVASFTEASVSASGETEADAIANFKEMMLSLYEIFESTPVDRMGPLPTRQWNILRNVVQRME